MKTESSQDDSRCSCGKLLTKMKVSVSNPVDPSTGVSALPESEFKRLVRAARIVAVTETKCHRCKQVVPRELKLAVA